MKRILKSLCAAAAVTGLCFGAAIASHAAWNGLDYLNECNTNADLPEVGAELVMSGAPDGSAYIKADNTLLHDNGTDALDIAFEMIFSDTGVESFCTWETDIMFTADDAGFSIRNNKGANQGNVNTTIKYGNGALHYSSATGNRICNAELNKWYHITLTGVYGKGQDNAIMNISIYDSETGELVGEDAYPGGKYGTVLRNDKAPTRFAFAPGTCVDNVKAYEMPPAAIELTTDAVTNAAGEIDIKAGESIAFGSNIYADAEKTLSMSGVNVVYEVWDTAKTEQLISDEVSISPQGGILTTAGAAAAQSFVVRVKCVDLPEVCDDILINVTSVPMIEFISAAFDDTENPTVLVNLKFRQNYDNEGDISFIAAVYKENGTFVDAYTKTLSYRDQKTGDLIITLNETLPEGFNKDTDTIKVFVWSKTIG